jgi:16S rRNA (guanine(527)-N(7))-methyltransferase RsmG
MNRTAESYQWDKDHLSLGLVRLGFMDSEDQHSRFFRYLDQLDRWNRIYNFTSIPPKRWVDKLILESASACRLALDSALSGSTSALSGSTSALSGSTSALKKEYWADLGTGAGVPGITLSILNPDRKILLVESRQKRTDFLHHIKQLLELKNMEIYKGRVERLMGDMPWTSGAFSVVFSRAMSPALKVMELAYPLLRDSAILIVPGGRLEPKNELSSEEYERKWIVTGNNMAVPFESCDHRCLILTRRGKVP